MLKITYYIFRQLSLSTLFISSILTLAVLLTQSLRFIDGVVNKGASISLFFYILICLLPNLIVNILPAALMVAMIYTYNKLITNQEVAVMRSAGMSNWQIAKPALIVTVIVTAFLYVTNLYLIAPANKGLTNISHNLHSSLAASMLQPEEFNTAKGITVYVHSKSSPTDLKRVLIYDNRDPDHPFFLTAAAGSVINTKKGLKIILIDGVRQNIDTKTNAPSFLYFDQYSLEINNTPQPTDSHSSDPDSYGLKELLNPLKRIASDINYSEYVAYGHMKLIAPLLAIAFALICLNIILSGEINRRRRAYKIMFIIIFSFLLQFVMIGLFNVSRRSLIMIPINYALFFVLIGVLLGRITQWFSLKEDSHNIKERR